MIMRFTPRIPGLWLAFGALALALAAAGMALARALRIERTDAVATATIVVPRIALPTGGPGGAAHPALSDDPFAPDRKPAATPYTLNRTGDSRPAPSAGRQLPLVLGTVIAPDGKSFAATVSREGEEKHAHVGDAVGTYVVVAIERGRVTFRAPSGKVVAVRPTGVEE